MTGPRPAPLRVRVELVVLHGPEAAELLTRQAAAVRDALTWLATHPAPTDHQRPTNRPGDRSGEPPP
ncbi:MAG: hypothetical protein HYR62_06160 [Actinobacteria bacterium]|nr:hypothetical protein [Actinomycetota bacterium]